MSPAAVWAKSKAFKVLLFGVAVSLEEAGEARLALAEFEKIVGTHPNPDLIESRIRRLRGKIGVGEGDNDGGGQGSE